MKKGFLMSFAAATVVFTTVAGSLSNQEISEFGGCYFAPMTSGGLWRMRTQDGEIREFESDAKKGNRLSGVGGWYATVKKGAMVSVHAPAFRHYPPMVYNFTNGRLSSLDVEGKHCRFSYPDPLVYEDEAIFPLWPDKKEITVEEFAETTTHWKNDGRLKLWFHSPNQAGAFIAMVFLLFTGLAFLPRSRRLVKGVVLTLALVAFAALVMTASRSALLGAGIGLVTMSVCSQSVRARLFSWKRLSIYALLFVILAAGVVVFMYSFSRSGNSDRKSDATRLELYKAAPVMMCGSPLGWGGYSAAGKAYSDWYAPESEGKFRLNLVSDHLTMLAGNGFVLGFLYVFGWFAVLALTACFAWRGGSPIPLGVLIALGVASLLNVVAFVPKMFWIPFGSLCFLVFDRRWFTCRILSVCAGFGALAALLCIGGIYILGRSYTLSGPSISKDGNRIFVNGSSPDIWIVDDGEAIGGALAPREIRAFYRKYPEAPAIGYVKDLSDVPKEGVKRVVLVGDSAQYFMVPFTRDPDSVVVPPEIVFLAPQFPPEAIPDELHAKSRVLMVIGEFAARYWEGFSSPPDWVKIVHGAEVYIPRWMFCCVETQSKEGE